MLWSTDQLVRHVFPHRRYLFDPIVPHGGIVLFHGKRGLGKSQLVLTMSAALEQNTDLFGRYRTEPGKVVYVQVDMTPQIQQERVQRARHFYDLNNVHFYFADVFNVAALRESDELVQLIRAEQPDLIVWDTLRKITTMDVNDDRTPSFIYGLVKSLFPGSTHCFIHHDKKTVVEQDELDPDEAFRGSGAWIDDADTGLRLTGSSGGRLQLTVTKSRTAERQEPLLLTLHPDTLLLYASSVNASALASKWQARNDDASIDQLGQYLLRSFTCSPRLVPKITEEFSNGQAQAHQPDGRDAGTKRVARGLPLDGRDSGTVPVLAIVS